MKLESEVAQSCPTLCNPMDCSLLGSSVHGIFQAIVLEWIAISFSRGSSQPRAWTRVSHIVDRCFTIWATKLSHEFTLAECGRKYGPRPDLAMSKELVDFPSGSDDKASIYNAGDPGSSPGLGRSPGEGNGNPLQYYCLENPMDRGAW